MAIKERRNPGVGPTDEVAGLRVLVVDETPARATLLEEGLAAAGCQIVAVVTPLDDLARVVHERQPDVIIVDVDSPRRDTLESLRLINREQPRPIVMFVDTSDNRTIEQAMKAGVSAYVIDGLNVQRVRSVLEVAIARFREYQSLRDELARTKSSLQDRKLIERAKGVLMQQRQISEDDAYRALRRLAMEQNQRLIDVARSLLAYAQVLKP